MYTEQLSQALSLGAPINPASQNTGSYNTGGIDMSEFRRAIFLIEVGSVGGAGTVDAKLQEATDSAFTTPTDVAGNGNVTTASITQITASNKQATIEIRAGQCSKRYVRCRVTIGGNAVVFSATPLGGEADHKPGGGSAAGFDDGSVSQRVVCS
jgi:hypothetical protein